MHPSSHRLLSLVSAAYAVEGYGYFCPWAVTGRTGMAPPMAWHIPSPTSGLCKLWQGRGDNYVLYVLQLPKPVIALSVSWEHVLSFHYTVRPYRAPSTPYTLRNHPCFFTSHLFSQLTTFYHFFFSLAIYLCFWDMPPQYSALPKPIFSGRSACQF